MAKGWRLAVSGVALTGLLALVAIASHAHRPGGGTGASPSNPPTLLIHWVVIFMIILFPLGALLVVWALVTRRRESTRQSGSNWIRSLTTVAFLLALLAIRVLVFGHWHRSNHSSGSGILGLTGRSGRGKPAKTTNSDWLGLYVLASVLFAFVVIAGAAIVMRYREGRAWQEEADLARALDAVLADTLEDLRRERDPRNAVIKAYARMEETFAAYGVPRLPAETPREYLARALEDLQVSRSSAERLTRLFSRAKFSTHAIDSGMKDEALEALTGLRAELEHQREEAA